MLWLIIALVLAGYLIFLELMMGRELRTLTIKKEKKTQIKQG